MHKYKFTEEKKKETEKNSQKKNFPNQIIQASHKKNARRKRTQKMHNVLWRRLHWVGGIFNTLLKRGNVQTILNTLRWIRNEGESSGWVNKSHEPHRIDSLCGWKIGCIPMWKPQKVIVFNQYFNDGLFLCSRWILLQIFALNCKL